MWGCVELPLPTCYRCGGAIVASAARLIGASSLREATPPMRPSASRALQGSVQVHVSPTREAELRRLATELLALQRRPEGTAGGTAAVGGGMGGAMGGAATAWPVAGVAVLCRTRAQVRDGSPPL